MEDPPAARSSTSSDADAARARLLDEWPAQLVLQVQVLEGRNLVAKDRGQTSDPFVVIKFANQRFETSTISKNLDPKWSDSPSTLVVNRRQVERLLASHPKRAQLRIRVFDRDTLGREFMGQVVLPMVELVAGNALLPFDDAANAPRWLELQPKSSRGSRVSGAILVKIGAAHIANYGRPGNVSPGTPPVCPSLPVGDDQALVSDLSDGFGALDVAETPYRSDAQFAATVGPAEVSAAGEDEALAGVLYLEIVSASNLPKLRSAVLKRFDMDPFVVITFGKKTYRTKHVRHSLNPSWREKMYIRVRNEDLRLDYPVRLAVWDHDRLSLHNQIGITAIPLSEIIASSNEAPLDDANAADPLRPQYRKCVDRTLAVQLGAPGKPAPAPSGEADTILTVRWRYLSAASLRKNFVWAVARLYDADESGAMNRVELQAMLDNLGSTLSDDTIGGFYRQVGKDPAVDELTYDELADCVERYVVTHRVLAPVDAPGATVKKRRIPKRLQIFRKKSLAAAAAALVKSPSSNSPQRASGHGKDGSCESEGSIPGSSRGSSHGSSHGSAHGPLRPLEGSQRPSHGQQLSECSKGHAEEASDDEASEEDSTAPPSAMPLDPTEPSEVALSENEEEERLFHLTGCFFCGKTTVSSNVAEDLDIISHIALCAHDDLNKVDNLVLGGFLTEAQASRKWYVKVLQYISYGGYSIGRRNANILVLDRKTGQLVDEKMPVYIRMGIRLMYQSAGASNAVQSRMVRNLLFKMSLKQGRKFDDPRSARAIMPFAKFHGLALDEMADPIDSFRTFNEFFYRKLKPGARVLASPDPRVLVSPADCRMHCFRSLSAATTLWIKGRNFGVASLLQSPELAQQFDGGSIAVFRLAPQDYHRFHAPVGGVFRMVRHIGGTYFTVNPMAVRTSVDVFCENTRTVTVIESPEFGTVGVVLVGAMMVGSIKLTATEGQTLARMDEIGYFAFGGSSIIVLFQANAVEFDRDLLQNSEQSLETLVAVGNSLGRCVRPIG